jgi:hypothetical protein
VSTQPETDALRRDMLTGHLLLLAAEDGLPRHALPALATSLQVQAAHGSGRCRQGACNWSTPAAAQLLQAGLKAYQRKKTHGLD